MALGKKTGGRQKGTPNKENPLKGYLRAHSLAYFEPKRQLNAKGGPIEVDGEPLLNPDGTPLVASDFEMDMMQLAPDDRVAAELRLLEFHTPKMKSVDVDMDIHGTVHTIEDRLKELCGETGEDED